MKIQFNQSLLNNIAKNFGIKFVILHGSFANGIPDSESDLDIAAVSKQPLDFKTELKLYGQIEEAFTLPPSKEFDFKMLNKVDPFFRYEVIKDGQLLFGNKADYEDYKAYSERAYLEDAKPLMELEKLLINKFQNHLNTKYAQ